MGRVSHHQREERNSLHVQYFIVVVHDESKREKWQRGFTARQGVSQRAN